MEQKDTKQSTHVFKHFNIAFNDFNAKKSAQLDQVPVIIEPLSSGIQFNLEM